MVPVCLCWLGVADVGECWVAGFLLGASLALRSQLPNISHPTFLLPANPGCPLAGDVAAATVRICRALLTGKTWQKALVFAADNRMAATQAAFEPVTEQQLSNGGYAPDVLQAALWFVGQSSNLVNALQRSIQFAGPSNYCPVLVGSIGGARWGVGSLKPEWFQHQGDMVKRLRAAARVLNSDRY